MTASGLVDGTTRLRFTVPYDVLAGGAETTLKVYPNLAAHLRDALVAMAVYPGGCAEQIISLAWPSLLLRRYQSTLPHPESKAVEESQRHLEEAYANLLSYRSADGGFRYWAASAGPDQRADLALTAYAVEFLTEARKYIAVDKTC